MQITIREQEYQELLRIKRVYQRLKFYLECKLIDLRSGMDSNISNDGDPIDPAAHFSLSEEIKELEELLK